MRELTIKSQIWEAQTDELSKKERELVKKAIDATERSYAPPSVQRRCGPDAQKR